MKLGTDDTTEKFSLFCEVWNQSLSRVAFVGHELDFEADWCGIGIIWYMVWMVWYGLIWTWYGMV